jgi:SAM-dependent methyltransferase
MADALPRKVLQGPNSPSPTALSRVVRLGLGALLFLPYLIAGWLGGCPGISYRLRCWKVVLGRCLRRPGLPLRKAQALVTAPLDSVRYFEFAFARECLAPAPPAAYLDVSSPRLFPLLQLTGHGQAHAVLLNPDRADLEETRSLVAELGVGRRCRLEGRLIAESGLEHDSFDAITSISVVEHIPEDSRALAEMLRLLRPGGRLVLTVPCAARPYEEWADFNKYGLLERTADGLVFWQRFYSQACLEARVFSILGQPAREVVYGERRPGLYDRNVLAKMRSPYYPVWREPWMMAREWKLFERIDQLPGVGVVGLLFIKPQVPS